MYVDMKVFKTGEFIYQNKLIRMDKTSLIYDDGNEKMVKTHKGNYIRYRPNGGKKDMYVVLYSCMNADFKKHIEENQKHLAIPWREIYGEEPEEF